MQAIIDSATRQILGAGIFTADPPEGQELVELTPEQEGRLGERGLKYLRQNGAIDVTLPQYAIDEDNRLAQERADRAAIIALITPIAQGAVGKTFNTLTATEVRALQAIQLWKDGALDNTGKVRPLAQWVKE